MNIVQAFTNALNWVVKSLKSLFTSREFKKTKEVAKLVGALMQFAIPAVRMIAELTPNKQLDDKIADLIERFSIPTALDPSKPLTELDKENILFAAAYAAFQGNLEEAIRQAGAAGLLLAGKTVKSSTDLPTSIVDAAIQNAYSFWKNSTEPVE